MCNLDTVCLPLLSPQEWAAKGDLPETRAHFAKVIAQIKTELGQPLPLAPACGSTCKNYDMARCASELNM